MCLFLKNQRKSGPVTRMERLRRWWRKKKEWYYRPRLGRKILQMSADAEKRMGNWSKFNHPVIGKPYYFNKKTGETRWIMPEEVKFFLSEDLSAELMGTFSPADIIDFEEKFSTMDLDNSGAIDREELRIILRAMGEKVTDMRLDSLIREVDMDQSGEIDFDEFCMMMKAVRSKDGGASGSWTRLNRKMEQGQMQNLSKLAAGYEKMKALRKRLRGKSKYPHGKFCLCGCRAFDPDAPRSRGCCYYFWCCACCCCPCACCCSCLKRKMHIFPQVPRVEQEKKNRRLKLKTFSNEAKPKNWRDEFMANK